jgi:hypothetical protein
MEARFDKLNATPSGLAQRVRFSGLSRTEVVVELVETQDFSPPNHAAKQRPEQLRFFEVFLKGLSALCGKKAS